MKLIDYIKQFWNGIPGWAKALVGGIGAGIAYLVATGAAERGPTTSTQLRALQRAR